MAETEVAIPKASARAEVNFMIIEDWKVVKWLESQGKGERVPYPARHY